MPATLRAGAWLALAVLFTLAWFAGLGTRALWHPDEGRYAEIAREMAQSGDWVTPRLDGLQYFEKPPLQYWVTALAYRAFGVREWTARLAPALFGWLAVLAVAWAGVQVAGQATGLLGAAALAGSAWPVGLAHFVSLDAVLAGCLAVALAAFLVAQAAPASLHRARACMLLAWAAIGAAVLAKGLVALVIPGGALVLYSLATRDFALWRRLEPVRGIALLLAVTAPWFVLVSSRNPGFAHFFFVHEHFERFLTTEHNREGPWWYFVPLLLAGLLPWTVLFLAKLPAMWRMPSPAANGFSWSRFCLAWCAFVFLFFSASGSKLPSYILPLFPAAALLIGSALARLPARTLAALFAGYAVSAAALALALALAYPALTTRVATLRTPAALYEALHPGIIGGLALAAASGAVAWLLARREPQWASRLPAVAIVSLGMIGALALAFYANDALSPSRSTRDLVAVLRSGTVVPYDAAAPFYQVSLYDQTLPFYLRRTTTVVDYRDELGPGLDAEPQLGIAHVADWLGLWRGLAQGYALLDPPLHARLVAEGVPMRIVVNGPRYVLVSRR
jgi:4-amino-4-deoxy-L-arabinose transferase-like glycosyltransferase